MRCGGRPGRPAFAGDAAGKAQRAALRRVRLALIPRRAGPGMQPDFAAEARDMFSGTGSDVAVVTDGGFVMAETDAPRVVWYCNSALRAEARDLSLPRPRHPRNMLRLWRFKRPIRARIAAARNKKSRSCRTARTQGGRCLPRSACGRGACRPPAGRHGAVRGPAGNANGAADGDRRPVPTRKEPGRGCADNARDRRQVRHRRQRGTGASSTSWRRCGGRRRGRCACTPTPGRTS